MPCLCVCGTHLPLPPPATSSHTHTHTQTHIPDFNVALPTCTLHLITSEGHNAALVNIPVNPPVKKGTNRLSSCICVCVSVSEESEDEARPYLSMSASILFNCWFTLNATAFSEMAPTRAGTEPFHKARSPSSLKVRTKHCTGPEKASGRACMRTLTVCVCVCVCVCVFVCVCQWPVSEILDALCGKEEVGVRTCMHSQPNLYCSNA